MTKNDMTCEEAFLTVEEAAKLLKLAEKTLYREIKGGNLKAHRFGRAIRLSRSDLAEYADERRT
jgi:excisionase family DNA binding protein